ncbi:MAG: PTS sugar transporter subunit IIA [Verrucomicrobia bacterium]|nr:PTS sugar transporter subunit IIA [Verrucomicrobiota bacterium]
MALYELLDVKSIITELQSDTKEGVIEELVDALDRAGRISDRNGVLDAVMERESQMSTGLEEGLAVPHAKSAAVSTLTAALGIKRAGLDFDSADGKLTRIVFLLVAEQNNPGPHVRALAQLARLLSDPAMRAALVNAKSSDEIIQTIKQRELA